MAQYFPSSYGKNQQHLFNGQCIVAFQKKSGTIFHLFCVRMDCRSRSMYVTNGTQFTRSIPPHHPRLVQFPL